MKLCASLFLAAALAATASVVNSAWAQTTTESDTTITTAPLPPRVTSKTVTRKTVVYPPPAVVVNPPASTSTDTTTTTESTTRDESAPKVEEKAESKTSYGPFGITHALPKVRAFRRHRAGAPAWWRAMAQADWFPGKTFSREPAPRGPKCAN